MIWAVYALMALGVAVMLAPAFFGEPEAGGDAELSDYFAQIDTLERDVDMDPDARDAAIARLQRQVLARTDSAGAPVAAKAGGTVLLSVAVLGAGLYALTGRPELAAPQPTVEAATPGAQAELEDLVAQLGQRLATDRSEDPVGWRLYARTLMSLGRTEESLAAYDRVVELTGGDTDAVAERDNARAVAAVPGPTARDVADAQSMSEADRAAMIQGMVDGLSERLETEPDDPAAWARLLRARVVLGQADTPQAREEVARLREAFVDTPQVAERVLREAGWPEGSAEAASPP